MAKTKRKAASRPQKSNLAKEYTRYIYPSLIGAVVTLIFSGSIGLALTVFIAVWVGTWLGLTLKEKK